MAHYFNSTFSIKPNAKRLKSKTSLKRSAMKRGGKLQATKPMKKAGKKSRAWFAVRRRLKVEFEARGITSCELRYEGCAGDGMLGFAHGRKRRHLRGNELETLTILACNHCHGKVEYLGPERMLAIVNDVIKRRLTTK